MKSLDCNYRCGTPNALLFHYKKEHKYKVSKCACGNQTISGNFVDEFSSKVRCTASKCSSSSSNSIFSSSSSSNPNSDSNLRSSFTNYISNSNSDSNSNSNSDSNSNLRSSFTDSNLQSNWGTTGEAEFHGRSPFTNSHIETKFDTTNKICRRCRVIKQITCFDKKKSICKEFNSTKVKPFDY